MIVSKPALACLCILAVPMLAFAQPPPDNLNGKIIHLYIESDDFTAFYFQNGDLPLKQGTRYEYSLTLSGRDIYQQDFFFTSNGNAPAGEHFKWKFGKVGLNDALEGRFSVSDFQGHSEMWIIVDPSGPLTAPPVVLFQAPKSINLLNPWPVTAPKLVYGTNSRSMTLVPGHCGWFRTLLLDSGLTSAHFAELNGSGFYGKIGYGSDTDYDITAAFTAAGPGAVDSAGSLGAALWLNTENNTWASAWPGLEGVCSYAIAATVRDMSKDHVDFEYTVLTGNFFLSGMVMPTLNAATRKPVRSANPSTVPVTFDTFGSWWITDSTNADATQRSYASCTEIPLGKTSDGQWEYDSYRASPTDHGFFPMEGDADHFPGEKISSCHQRPFPDTTSWVTGGPARNFNFCMEAHATFIHQKGQRIELRGADDIWGFIDGKLVLDIGGIHVPQSGSVNVDTLGLTLGKEYPWDLFFCNRQPCASALRLKTSIYFKQVRPLDLSMTSQTDGSFRYKLIKRLGGEDKCSLSDDSTVEVAPTQLVFALYNGARTKVEDLKDGSHYGGGLVIAAPNVTVDTSKFTGLPGGAYRLMASEAANPSVSVEITFHINGPVTGILQRRALVPGHPRAQRDPDALGRRLPVLKRKSAPRFRQQAE
ncbi:MAG: fibro-slime domain-containing protein [Fibrobacteria bacterium]